MKIPCPSCQMPLVAPEGQLGRRVRCPRCRHRFVLSQAQALVPPTPPQGSERVASDDDVDAIALEPASGGETPEAAEPAPGGSSALDAPRVPRDVTVSRSMVQALGLKSAPPDALICRLDPASFAFVEASSAAREFFGVEPGAAELPTFLDAVHPDDRVLALAELRRAIEQGERHELVLRLRGRDGQWRFVRLDAQSRHKPGGALEHVRCHFVDVHDRIREEQELRRRTEQLTEANEQLRRANALLREAQSQLVHSEKLASLGTLAAGMAHEINNPLSFATNNAAVLERDTAAVLELLAAYQEGRDLIAAADPALAERIVILERASDLSYVQQHMVNVARSTRRGLKRVAQIVANLRAFARLDRSLLTELDPNESLEQALSLLSDHFARHHVRVTRDYAPLPDIECSAAAVNQVLFHLLMNAAHAVEDSGRGSGHVKVTTRVEGSEVVVEVADDGCGIPLENLPRIFDPFFTTKEVGRGTGLGLSISHGIIQEHGGRIDVESSPGAGSTFRVRLPARPAAR